VFHTTPWLEALRRTYKYEPVVITTSPLETDVQNGAIFCYIDSWATGRRLVSLPFSDHCDVLGDSDANQGAMMDRLAQELNEQQLRYVELRTRQPLNTSRVGAHSTSSYCFHEIDLTPSVDALFCSFHKDSTQRKIRRAERERLTYCEGASMLESFYELMVLTRRRHSIPPQPKKWFFNLIDCFKDALKIRIAFKDKRPIAAMMTLRYRDTLVYKYGCSDAALHHLGGMQFLFWRAIQEAKHDALHIFDLGRSDWDDTGLITFKDRLGAKRSEVTYLRLLASAHSKDAYKHTTGSWKRRVTKKVVPYLPDPILRGAGALVYRHIG
jgi:hypothetical protein